MNPVSSAALAERITQSLYLQDVERRLQMRTIVIGSPCHVWIHTKDDDGYAQMNVEGVKRHLARWLLQRSGVSIPSGMVIDHICRNRACINIEHLEVVSIKENTLRGSSFSAQNAMRIRCERGHNNWRVWFQKKDGKKRRLCRDCQENYPSNRKKRKK